jgi:sugar phosphate isomerase/epimerase
LPPLKVGIQLASLKQPIKEAVQTAARLGADAVEIDARGELRPATLSRTALRQLHKMLDDLRLSVCAVTFHTRHGYHVSENLDRRIAATKAAMDFAYAVGANVVVNHVGRVPAEKTGLEWDLLLESLTDLGRHGQRCGAVLAAETGSESGPTLAGLIDALPEGSLFVNFDPGNLVVNDYSVDEALTALARHIQHVHAKDGVRDLAQGRGLEVPLGRGSVDFPSILAVLEQQRYGGYFTVERKNAHDPVAEIGAAVSYLRQALQ